MTNLIRRRPYLTYYGLAVAFPTFLFIYLFGLEILLQAQYGPDYSYAGQFYALRDSLIESYPILFHHQDSVLLYLTGYVFLPLAAPFFFFPFGPTAAALIVTWIGGGTSRIKGLLGHFKPVRGSLTARDGAQIYAAMIGGIFTLVAALFLVDRMLNDGARLDQFVQTLGLFDWRYFLSATLMALFLNQGGLLEELGWRGYGLPLLIRQMGSPLIATLILGVTWALWHFPREVPGLAMGQQSLDSLLFSQSVFILSCCSMSVVATYFVNITGGSVLPAIMIHGTLNHAGFALSTAQEGFRSEFTLDAPLMWFFAALVILLVAGPNLGWNRRLEIEGGEDAAFAHLPPRPAGS